MLSAPCESMKSHRLRRVKSRAMTTSESGMPSLCRTSPSRKYSASMGSSLVCTGLPEPLPQVGVDSAGTLQEFGLIELAVGARARILVEPADDALGELVGVVFD